MAAQKKPARKPAVRRKQKAAPTHEQIAARAYFLHLEDVRTGQLENWLRAERELTPA